MKDSYLRFYKRESDDEYTSLLGSKEVSKILIFESNGLYLLLYLTQNTSYFINDSLNILLEILFITGIRTEILINLPFIKIRRYKP